MKQKLILLISLLSLNLSALALPSAEDLQGTINLCSAGRSVEVKANINASLKKWLKGASALGEVRISDMGAIIKETKNDQIRVEALSIYHSCVKTVLPIFIAADQKASKAKSTSHSHGERTHQHDLPAKSGLSHRHNGGSIGTTNVNQSSNSGNGCRPNISIASGSSGNVTVNCKPNHNQKNHDTNAAQPQTKLPAQRKGILLTQGSINFLLKGCNQSGSTIKCDFTVWNSAEDGVFTFRGLYNTKLYDVAGNEYHADDAIFGDVLSRGSSSIFGKVLIKDIRVDGRMLISGLKVKGDRIPLLKISIYKPRTFFSFRDVKL